MGPRARFGNTNQQHGKIDGPAVCGGVKKQPLLVCLSSATRWLAMLKHIVVVTFISTTRAGPSLPCESSGSVLRMHSAPTLALMCLEPVRSAALPTSE
eukprot:6178575-Pleurochrysis_carterae.AAC.13